MPECCDAKLLQVLFREARKNRLVYLVLAECRLILPEAKAPQPDHDVHNGAPNSGLRPIIVRALMIRALAKAVLIIPHTSVVARRLARSNPQCPVKCKRRFDPTFYDVG
jgi:hypothetical protein